MEGRKQVGSSSSISSDLFGAKDSTLSSSSMGIFGSVFPPPSTVGGRESLHSEIIGSLRKQNSGNQVWNSKTDTPGNILQSSEGESRSIPTKDTSSIYQHETVEPCYLSSSLYYGGQDIYTHTPNTGISGSHTNFKKDGGEDDPNGNNLNSASRGNWWQGMGHSITKTLPPTMACEFSIYTLWTSRSLGKALDVPCAYMVLTPRTCNGFGVAFPSQAEQNLYLI
ncbi:hypothetical protein HHK36_018462 [Tetracentron sinense]|uniref:Uncharacterized protein n=1 Tax=Tetracentron sinense TaxID=13715 RepID=A0A835DAC6_TETSI|nr:hypothetical protein HHK36_018462 [Tetracentron sinense]